MKKTKKLFNIISNILKTIIYILLIIILIFNIITIINKIINPDKVPSILNYKNFIVKSGSMMPSINIGDLIIVKKIPENKLEIGDIITYKTKNNYISHRLVEKQIEEEITYTTKGDYNNINDTIKLHYNDIEGKVVKVIPKVGKILLALQNKSFIIILIVIAIIFFFIKDEEK